MKQKILVCGATGFIGRNMVEFFSGKNEYNIYGTYYDSPPIIKNKNINMLKADLRNYFDVQRVVKGMDIIIQAAATTSGVKDIVNSPYYHVTDNAVMNSLIFRAAHENKVTHVVFFSCTVMYQSSNVPIKETDFNANEQMYSSYFGVGWTKVYLEKMCEFYARLGVTKYTVLRHSNIYGHYDKFELEKSHVFAATVTKVMTSTNGKIVVWGQGEEERDLLYVSDLNNFVEVALHKQMFPFELYNVGCGSAVSVRELVKKIIFYSGKNIYVEYDTSKPTVKTKVCLDISKARNELGWSPNVSLEEGIQKTLQWYQNNVKLGGKNY